MLWVVGEVYACIEVCLVRRTQILKLFAAALRHRRDKEGDRRLFDAAL